MKKGKKVKTHVKKGDLVQVVTGDNKGMQGVILEVRRTNDRHQNARVIVEGVNMIKKAVRPSQDRPQGGFVEREAAIHISNVKRIENSK